MIETFIALLFAHVLADYPLQTTHMVETKKSPKTLALHALIVLLTAYAALGRLDAWEPVALAAAHLIIDVFKAHALPRKLWSHLLDQALHIATILTVSILSPTLFSAGIWAEFTVLPQFMVLTSGAIVATMSGRYAIQLLISGWDDIEIPKGLPNGGALIGLLERGIIFLLIIVGQPAGIGFLIAAKSVLRFDSGKDQKISEYVIIGTLASFGWAMIVGWVTVSLLSSLPPLGFPPFNP